MDHLYLDESGESCLKDSSAYTHFLLTVLFVKNHDSKKFKNKLKRVFATFINKGWDRNKEIKAFDLFRDRRYGKAAVEEVIKAILDIKSLKINYIVVNKPKIKSESLRTAPYGIVYNYFTGILLSEMVCFDGINDINLTYDVRNKETHGHLAFNEYLHTHIVGKAFEAKREVNFAKRGVESSECYGIMATDFISWGIFRKYEYNDDYFYKLMKHKFARRKRWYV